LFQPENTSTISAVISDLLASLQRCNKSNVISVTGNGFLHDSVRLRITHFLENCLRDEAEVSALRTGAPWSSEIFYGTYSSQWLLSQVIVCLEGLTKLKNRNNLIGNLTGILSAFSVVPQKLSYHVPLVRKT
jgi:hypothetical protein